MRLKPTVLFTMDHWMLASTLQDNNWGKLAVAIYVAYHIVNHVRHQHGVSLMYIRHYFNQMLHKAARDDLDLRRCCGGLAVLPRRGSKRARTA